MNYLEIVGTLVGLLYLWFEYKASIWLWPVSVIMPAIYIVVYYQVGLYACLLYTSPSPRDVEESRMPSSA